MFLLGLLVGLMLGNLIGMILATVYGLSGNDRSDCQNSDEMDEESN